MNIYWALCARHCTKYAPSHTRTSQAASSHSMKWVVSINSFYRWENWGTMRSNDLSRCSQLLWFHLLFQKTKGRGVTEPRLCSAVPAPVHFAMDKYGCWSYVAPQGTPGTGEEQAGCIWQRGNILSISLKTTSKTRVGSIGLQGALARMLGLGALSRMNQLSSGCYQLLKRNSLTLGRDRANTGWF